jgi:hypothetical protein
MTAADWLNGYQAALDDVKALAQSREFVVLGSRRAQTLNQLLADLRQDALVIEHETGARLQRRRLAAAREAQPQGSLL